MPDFTPNSSISGISTARIKSCMIMSASGKAGFNPHPITHANSENSSVSTADIKKTSRYFDTISLDTPYGTVLAKL